MRPVEDLVWNTTAWVESVETSVGGNGSNTALAAAAMGAPVRLVGYAGSDELGDRLLARLRAAGIDLTFVRRGEAPTASTVVLVRANGDRMFLHRPGISAEAFAEPVEFTSELTAGAGFFHLGNAFALPHMRRNAAETLRRARAAGLVTSMDAGWDARGRWLEDLGAALPHTDLLFVNEEEALKLSGAADYTAAAAKLKKLGAESVIVKRGGQGCAVFSGGAMLHVPAYEVEAVDTTGAGDCFAGAYLAALARGEPAACAARVANAAGALVVQKLGAVTGLRPWEETLAWMRRQRAIRGPAT